MKLIRNNDISVRRKILANVLKEYFGYDDIAKFQADNSLNSDGLFGRNSYEVLYKKILNVKDVPNFTDYYQVAFPKNQIVLHHSASNDNASNMFKFWQTDKRGKVATSIGIDDKGTIWNGFDGGFWAHHIGMSNKQNLARNQQSVAVEIMNWGFLYKRNGRFYSSYATTEIPEQNVIELKFRGQKFFEKYTVEEILALKKWILLNAIRFDVPLQLDIKEIFDVSQRAINGAAGVWTHCTYRSDKLDIVPQPIMVNMLESLANYEK